MTTVAARPTRFLSVAFDTLYGIREISVYVSCQDPETGLIHRDSAWHTARPAGSFRGEALEDFKLTAYVGHEHPASYEDPHDVWGYRAIFTPSQIHRAEVATRIAATLRALERAMDAISYTTDGPGAPTSFADYLRRMGAILRSPSLRIWTPTAGGNAVLGAPVPLTTGADMVEQIGRAWASGEPLHAACSRILEAA